MENIQAKFDAMYSYFQTHLTEFDETQVSAMLAIKDQMDSSTIGYVDKEHYEKLLSVDILQSSQFLYLLKDYMQANLDYISSVIG